MSEFLYPLPKEYYDQTTDDRIATQYYGRSYHGGHTYNGHGRGKLDLNCVEGTPVRSMTDGRVTRAGRDNSSPHYSSVWIEVSGHYLGLDSSNHAAWIDDSSNPGHLVIRYYHISNFQVSTGDYVKQGDILGYVGDPCVGANGAHLHLDFTSDGQHLMEPLGILKDGGSQLTPDQLAGFQRWCRDENLPGRCWEVIISEAVWKEAGTLGANGGLVLSRDLYNSCNNNPNDQQQALDYYFNTIIPDSFVKIPSSLQELNSDNRDMIAARMVINNTWREFGGALGNYAGASYAKLWRATIIGDSYRNKPNAKDLYDWIYNGRLSGWMDGSTWKRSEKISSAQYDYALATLKNLKYPELFGQELGHSGKATNPDHFNDLIYEAASKIPKSNGCASAYDKRQKAFQVSYKPGIDKTVSQGFGTYLLYRVTADQFKWSGSLNLHV